MRNRQPADQRMDPYAPSDGRNARAQPCRAAGADAPAGHGRAATGGDREPRRASPLLRVLSGLFTFVLLLMLLVGGVAYLFDSQIDAPGPLETSQGR